MRPSKVATTHLAKAPRSAAEPVQTGSTLRKQKEGRWLPRHFKDGDAPTVPSLERVQHREDAASEFPPFSYFIYDTAACCAAQSFPKRIATDRILGTRHLFCWLVLVGPEDFSFYYRLW